MIDHPRASALALGLVLLFVSVVAVAESLFELRPPGEPMLALDAHALALGGAAEGRWDLESGLPSNPAQLVAIEGVTFATVIQLRRGLRELPGEDWDETRQDFPAFQVSAALPWNLRLGLGYRADLRSRGSFSQVVPYELSYGDLGEDSYTVNYDQDGGLNRFPISLALPVGERHRIGLGLNLYRGNQNQEWFYDFPNVSGDDPDLGYQDRRVQRRARWDGTGLVLGLQSQPLGERATFSARWEAAADLAGESQVESAGEEDLELEALAGRMPSRWAIGMAFNLPKGGLASLQWEHEAWSDYDAPLEAADLADVDRFGLGIEWLWGEAKRGRRHRQFPIRLGLRMGNWPARDPLSGGEVSERTFSLGTGFDVSDGMGSLDFTLYWQQLDVDSAEGERRLGLALSLRTSERWQKRTQPF